MFADEADADASAARDPVAPAQRSKAALAKAHDAHAGGRHAGDELHPPAGASGHHRAQHVAPESARIGEATFTLTTRPNPKQQHALDLLAAIAV